MSFVTTSVEFTPILGVLGALVILTVIVVVIASAVRAGRAGAAAYFVFGLSLLTLSVGVATAGITTHSISELVGPAPQNFDTPPFPDCSSSSGSSSLAPTTSSTTSTTVSPSESSGLTAFCNALQSGQASSGEGRIIGSSSDLIAASDDTNHFISLSVLAGLFLITSATGYYWFWRRARKLTEEVGLGESPIGGLPVTYGYLIAGLAVVSLLVFVPLTADNIFRAIAPGVNETSGHAEGIRNLVTFVVLSGLSALILGYHLRYLRLLRASHPAANVDSLPEASQPPPET